MPKDGPHNNRKAGEVANQAQESRGLPEQILLPQALVSNTVPHRPRDHPPHPTLRHPGQGIPIQMGRRQSLLRRRSRIYRYEHSPLLPEPIKRWASCTYYNKGGMRRKCVTPEEWQQLQAGNCRKRCLDNQCRLRPGGRAGEEAIGEEIGGRSAGTGAHHRHRRHQIHFQQHIDPGSSKYQHQCLDNHHRIGRKGVEDWSGGLERTGKANRARRRRKSLRKCRESSTSPLSTETSTPSTSEQSAHRPPPTATQTDYAIYTE